ncbi:CvpA family protein [Halomonas halocynthiae]|uniref:CvpA family protein n=1 Tax=Halomonas halocynthiae TaxID=176290 RepID=UPI0003F72EE0|nr:CvpA family protein [Halomonas halocynthiae]
MALTWLDWLCIALLTLTALSGLMRGLIREVLGLVGWLAAILAARLLSPEVAEHLAGVIDSPDARLLVAFVLVVAAVIIIFSIVIRMLRGLLGWAGLGVIDHLGGAAFGMLKGGAILVVMTLLISLTPLDELQAWEDSALRPQLEQLSEWTITQASEWKDKLPDVTSSIDELKQRVPLPNDEAAGTPERTL